MKIIKIFGIAIATFAVITAASCKKDKSIKKFNGPEFNLETFDQELRTSLQPSGAIGWGYVITQNGLYVKGGGFGKVRNNADGNKSFTVNRKVNIASCSKWLTAIAVMQLLEKRNLNINSKIDIWLPPTWSKGPNVNNLTFGQLLGHTSGLSSYNTAFSRTLTYSGLQRCIDTGVVRPQTRQYLNVNFALFRVLIPSLWKGLPGSPNMPLLDSATTQNAYIQYMQEFVFEPIGLTGIDCQPENRTDATLYYSTTDGETNSGLYYNDWTPWCGGGGYFMSCMEMARVLAYYRHSETIISKDSRTVMEENRFGYNLIDASYEKHGTYLSKNGSIINGGQGVLAEVQCYPNGIEVVVFMNSQGMVFSGGETTLSRAIFDAYNKSWQ